MRQESMDPVAVHREQAGGGGAGCMIVNAYVCAHSHMHHFNKGLT